MGSLLGVTRDGELEVQVHNGDLGTIFICTATGIIVSPTVAGLTLSSSPAFSLTLCHSAVFHSKRGGELLVLWRHPTEIVLSDISCKPG
jgi:hypothetical protein